MMRRLSGLERRRVLWFWMFSVFFHVLNKAKTQVVQIHLFIRRLSHGNPKDHYVRLKGLDNKTLYRLGDKVFYGSFLMNYGLLLPFTYSADLEAIRARIKAL